MDIKQALASRKSILRQAIKESDRTKRQTLFAQADGVLEEISRAKANGTATNDIKTAEDAYGLMAH